MKLTLSPSSIDDYRTFLKVKRLPTYRVVGRTVEFPDQYAAALGLPTTATPDAGYRPAHFLFDYQEAIARLAIFKRKFAVFAECGLGKSLIFLEYARHVADLLPKDKCVLIVSPLMVISQTLAEAARFYGTSLNVERVTAKQLPFWMKSGDGRIGITNYDALTDDVPADRLGALILDESSFLKSAYGKWGQTCIRLGKGLEYKLALTGTPAPNDRIEYANHAVFLDHFPTVNSFLARFFVNRGETANRWELKPHALAPFYRSLSHWCIFLNNPATYGWRDNAETIPPIDIRVEDVPMTVEQRAVTQEITGTLFGQNAGGFTTRSKLSQIAKGNLRGGAIATNKPAFIRDLIASWPDESTIVWCRHNAEQDIIERFLPGAASIRGATPYFEREQMIARFKAGEVKTLISKPSVLGFGLNLQVATRQVFNGLDDSYESFYQAVKRSNRIGSTKSLHVHIPITSIERPMAENVLRKANRVNTDAAEQERIFKGEWEGLHQHAA